MDKITRLIFVLLALIAPAQAQTLLNLPGGQATTPFNGTEYLFIQQNGLSKYTLATTFFANAPILGTNNIWTGTNTFNNTVSGTGITNLFASPPAIGGTTANSGAFTTLSVSSTVSGTGFSNYLASPPAIGGTTANTGKFTTLTTTSTVTLGSSTIALGASGTFWPGHSLIGVQTFCASGCTATGGTYTADSGTNQVIVETQAPGGGSGGCAATSASNWCLSAPGAGGSYAKVLVTASFSGVTVTVGSAGTAGSSGNNAGGTGGTTSFGSIVSCPGGGGGNGGASSAFSAFVGGGGSTGSPSACTVSGATKILLVTGQQSSEGMVGGTGSGQIITGAGGPAALGLMSAMLPVGSTTTGATPNGYGPGGGGAGATASQSATAGAAGAPAIVLVYEFN
jgi:hypothetical protein